MNVNLLREFYKDNKIYFYTFYNSTFVYIITYLLIFCIYQASTVLIASNFGIETRWYYYGIQWLISDFSPTWTHDSVITTFIAGPVISIFIALLALFIVLESLYFRSLTKLFFLWLFVHALIRVIISFVISNILFLYGSNLVADWLYISMEAKMSIMLFGVIFLVFVGVKTSGAFMLSGNSNQMIQAHNRLKLLMFILVLPWFASSIILTLFSLPLVKEHELFIYLSPILIIIPAIIKSPLVVLFDFEQEEGEHHINWIFGILCFIFIILFRTLLNSGIYFAPLK